MVPGPAAAAAKISSEGMQAVITLCLPGEGRATSFMSSSYSIKPFAAKSFFSYTLVPQIMSISQFQSCPMSIIVLRFSRPFPIAFASSL